MQQSALTPQSGALSALDPAGNPPRDMEAEWKALASRLQLDSPDPLYRRVSMRIEDLIEGGVLQPGEQLDSERRLTELLKVSRRTVRAALGDLIERGYVRATHGRGNYVRLPVSRRELRFLALERFAPERGSMNQAHYDLVHAAEAAIGSSVHYKYIPSIEKLRGLLHSPPDGYDGILLFRPSQNWLSTLLEMQNSLNDSLTVPLVTVGRDLGGSSLNYVSADHFGQAYRATRDLVQGGHRRIGYVSGSQSLGYLQQAFKGYLQALEEGGLTPHPDDQRHFDTLDSEPVAFEIIPYLQQRKFTAVVVNGSALSLAFDLAVQRTGIDVPRQLAAVIVCEEFALSRLALCWDTYIYPDRRVIRRSLEVMAGLSRGQDCLPVQEVLTARRRDGISCVPASAIEVSC